MKKFLKSLGLAFLILGGGLAILLGWVMLMVLAGKIALLLGASPALVAFLSGFTGLLTILAFLIYTYD